MMRETMVENMQVSGSESHGIKALMWVGLLAALTGCSQFEYASGLAVGLGWAAPSIPVMADSFVMAALLAGRDVRVALAVLSSSVTVGAVHKALLSPGDWRGQAVMGVAVAAVATVVTWRLERLFSQDRAARLEAARLARVEAATAATPAPVEAATVTAPPAAKRPAKKAATGSPRLAVRALPIGEQVAWLKRKRLEHPEWTRERLAEESGLSVRTVDRRLEERVA